MTHLGVASCYKILFGVNVTIISFHLWFIQELKKQDSKSYRAALKKLSEAEPVPHKISTARDVSLHFVQLHLNKDIQSFRSSMKEHMYFERTTERKSISHFLKTAVYGKCKQHLFYICS